MSFDTDGIYDLRDEFDRRSQSYEAASAATTTISAKDTTGSITVTIVPGSPLEVQIGNAWAGSYSPAELGGAIVSTVTALATQRLEEWGEAVAESDEKAEPRTRPMPPESESPTARLRDAIEASEESPDLDAVFTDLLSILEEVNAGLESTMETIAQRTSAVHSGEDAGGRATAVVDGSGALVSIEFDERWLLNRSAFEVSNAANSAIAAAAQSAASEAPANPLAGTQLERFGSMLTDPDALSRIVLRRD